MVQVYQDGLQIQRTYQLTVYADYINIIGVNVNTVVKKLESLLATSKKIL